MVPTSFLTYHYYPPSLFDYYDDHPPKAQFALGGPFHEVLTGLFLHHSFGSFYSKNCPALQPPTLLRPSVLVLH